MDSKSDTELIAQLRGLLDLYTKVKQPWSYEKLEKATIAALPRLLQLAEQGLKVDNAAMAEDKPVQPQPANDTPPSFEL